MESHIERYLEFEFEYLQIKSQVYVTQNWKLPHTFQNLNIFWPMLNLYDVVKLFMT